MISEYVRYGSQLYRGFLCANKIDGEICYGYALACKADMKGKTNAQIKKRGREVAIGRMLYSSTLKLPNSLGSAMERFKQRAEKYFNNPKGMPKKKAVKKVAKKAVKV